MVTSRSILAAKYGGVAGAPAKRGPGSGARLFNTLSEFKLWSGKGQQESKPFKIYTVCLLVILCYPHGI